MAGITADIDFREAVGQIRYYLQGLATRSVNDPGVREAIFQDIYNFVSAAAPVDTGALRVSPIYSGAMPDLGSYDHRVHYANGYIKPRGNFGGISWDPYYINKYGMDVHYAKYVGAFRPQEIINDSTSQIYDIVAQHIIKEMNDDQR